MAPRRPAVNKVIRLILPACLGGLLSTAGLGQTIVWTDQSARRIQKKDVNGGEVETIVQFPTSEGAAQIHYDPVESKLYYQRFGSSGVIFQRSNLDGTEPQDILTPSLGTFTLNVDSRKLYWISGPSINVLNRSELDGSGAVSHAYPSCCLNTLEAFGDDLFFGAGGVLQKGIWRADADGSNEQFLHSSGEPKDLVHDPVENKLYVAAVAKISRMNLDGTGFQQVVSLPQWELVNSLPTQVVVDPDGRKLYWADSRAKVIQRSNLDGSNIEDFVTAADAGNPDFDIAGLTIVHGDTVPGACCDGDPFTPCTENAILSACQCATCSWHKLKTCDEVDCPRNNPIPTVSGWGLAVLGLLVLIAAKITFAARVRAIDWKA